MLPQEFFGILHAVMAVLVLFEHFSGKLCLNFFVPNSECSTKYGAFCLHISNCACLRPIVIEEDRNYGKFVFIKNIL